MTDANGELVFDLTLDYLSEDPDAPCGYSSLGVAGGEGKVRAGDPDAILGRGRPLHDDHRLRRARSGAGRAYLHTPATYL